MSNLPTHYFTGDFPDIEKTHSLMCDGCKKHAFDLAIKFETTDWLCEGDDCPDTENCDGTFEWVEKEYDCEE